MKQHTPATVITQTQLTDGIFALDLHAPGLAEAIRPGQFVMVYLDRSDLLLPRPISVCQTNGSTLQIVYAVVGQGTQHMSKLTNGQPLQLTGPLGNGFYAPKPDANKIALVGGGIGTPPLLALLQSLSSVQAQVDVYLGFRDQPILINAFQKIAANVHIATDTGTHGHKGNAIDLLKNSPEKYDEILACGPQPMLKALAAYAAEANISCQVCMEERMGCGIGTCVGCAIKTTDGYLKVCVDGPVFYSDKVVWDA